MGRTVMIVLDSVGVGELPDAARYGDTGSNTLGHISQRVGGLRLPNMEKLGLGNIEGAMDIRKEAAPEGSYGRMAEMSAGKDTTTGHWEIAGIILDKPFPVYPDGFPPEIIDDFESKIGTKVIGNYPASGTEIINTLGEQHIKTGYPIVYTSADSVFQIAAHEGVIPIERLYEICRVARGILKGENAVGRVIARPFTGTPGNFVRTDRRHDFSISPPHKTVLDLAREAGCEVKAVGKIVDLFNGQGITDSVHVRNNMDGVDKTINYMSQSFNGIIFTNLVDFDMLYGHRNDVGGYAGALADFDGRLPEIIEAMKDDDVLFITADHGCDPTTSGTDHTREYVPLLVYGRRLKKGVDLGTRKTFADLGATVAEFLGTPPLEHGISFYKDVAALK